MADGRQVPCPLRAAATASPESPAISTAGEVLTYGELDRRISAAAARLEELGCASGTRVTLYLPKDEGYVVLLLALIRTGAVACPLSTRLPPRGIAPLLERISCRALISDNRKLFEATDPGIRKLPTEAVVSDGPPIEVRDSGTLGLERSATIVFTSGSSGRPKAALHTFGNHYHSALGSNENIPLAPGDRWLHLLPLYHVGGLSILFRCLLAGATMVLPEAEKTVGESITEYGVTHVSLVATQLRRLLAESESSSPEGLKAVLLGGSAIPAHLLEEAASRGLPVHTSYGLTEMASQVTTTLDSSPAELRTSGRVLPHREVRVSDDSEILLRGETLFAGYVEGDSVHCPVDNEGWFHTGDLGALDEEGRLLVRGRMDNLFISGGENIQSEEIEDALCAVEGVARAVVVPVPDPEFGARPVAFVRMAAGGAPEPEVLREALEPVLPRFEIPAKFYEWPEDAAPEGMKVDRASFRERARRMSH